ncbi:hypothetical protein ES703_91862 [subsurface metagenome]
MRHKGTWSIILLIFAISLFSFCFVSCTDEPTMTKEDARTHIAYILTHYLPRLTELPDVYSSGRILCVPDAIYVNYKGDGKWVFGASVSIWRGQWPSSGGYDLSVKGNFYEISRAVEITKTSVSIVY